MLQSGNIGATVIYRDSGIYGLVSRQQCVGKIVAEKPCRLSGLHFLVEVEGFNLPRLVREDEVIGYVHPSIQGLSEMETKTTAEAAVFA